MRWDDERYVRIYTRDTAEWMALSWEARALLVELLRKADRAGFVQTGKLETKGVAGLVRMPLDVVERALDELLEDGCISRVEKGYLFPNFVQAQETRSSPAQRKRDQRERDRDGLAADGVRAGPATSGMMATHERKLAAESPAVTTEVTSSHTESPTVTSGHSVLCRAVPSRAVPRERAPEPPVAGPRPFEGITESVKAACVMAGAPLPTQAHVIAYENHREENAKAKTEQGFVSWMIREKSFARSSSGSGLNGRSDPPLTSAAYRPLKVS